MSVVKHSPTREGSVFWSSAGKKVKMNKWENSWKNESENVGKFLPVLERFPILLPGALGWGLQQAFVELPGSRQIDIEQMVILIYFGL